MTVKTAAPTLNDFIQRLKTNQYLNTLQITKCRGNPKVGIVKYVVGPHINGTGFANTQLPRAQCAT